MTSTANNSEITYQGEVVQILVDTNKFIVLGDNQKRYQLGLNAWQEPFPVQVGYRVEFGKKQNHVWVKYVSKVQDSAVAQSAPLQVQNQQSNYVENNQQYTQNSQNHNQNFNQNGLGNIQISKPNVSYQSTSSQSIAYPYGIFGTYKLGFKRAFDFKGRSRRKEFWYFHLVNTIILIILMISISILAGLLAVAGSRSDYQMENMFESFFAGFASIVIGLFLLITFIPSISLLVHRTHDINFSGWYVLLCAIPYIGVIPQLIIGFKDTYPQANQWGNPAK